MKKAILQALEKKYEAQIAEADATIKIYLENSVGIGEHPQHIEECDKLISKIAEADATITIYLNNSVGIGEHPQHIDEINKQVEKIANAKEKMEVLDDFKPEKGTVL